jgi:3-carboxy-cis,cis-muconate cycloisomerase
METVAAALADALGLPPPGPVWHSARDGVVAYGNWLALVTGSLGKMGQDIALMAQQGIEAVRLRGGGTSSAMPHKQNPIAAETLVTLARFNAVQIGGLHQAMVHEQERSGAAWALEWMIMPQMCEATGAALKQAEALLSSIETLGEEPV